MLSKQLIVNFKAGHCCCRGFSAKWRNKRWALELFKWVRRINGQFISDYGWLCLQNRGKIGRKCRIPTKKTKKINIKTVVALRRGLVLWRLCFTTWKQNLDFEWRSNSLQKKKWIAKRRRRQALEKGPEFISIKWLIEQRTII